MLIVSSCIVPSHWEGCTEAFYLQPKTSQWLKGSILGISLSAPWNCCSHGICWGAGGQALQHQSHQWLEIWVCKKVICIIFLSEAITAVLAFSDGRPAVLLPLRNYYQMEGINHKRILASKLLKPAVMGISGSIYFCGLASKAAWSTCSGSWERQVQSH